MITNEEARQAIEKYQKEHPLHFGQMIDVTAISSKEGADIISQTIDRVSKKVDEDTELWCICEMAKMYMRGVKPVYPVRQESEWIPVGERLPEEDNDYLITYEFCGENEVSKSWFNTRNGFVYDNVIAWQPLPEPYKTGEEE